MQPTPASSFFRFTLGFFVFLAVFLGVTYSVNKIAAAQAQQQAAAAAEALMLQQK
jgi:hypothetical protein